MEPRKTFGCFEGKAPITEEPFYKPMDRFYTDQEFHRATVRKTPKKTVTVEVPKKRKHTQGYYGLVVEKIFTHLSKQDMDEMREMEIDSKMGCVKYKDPIFTAIKSHSQELSTE